MGIPLAEKVVRTVAVYGGLIVLLRIGGKRDLAQLNSFDLVVLLLLSNVVQNAIIGNDNSLTGGLIGAAVLLAANGFVNRAAPKPVREYLEGGATPLVEHGKLDTAKLKKLGLREDDVDAALLRQGASSRDEVKLAELKPGGSIVVEFEPGAENATKGDLDRLEAKLDRLLAGQGS
jgi:uncharacterized membrane protein YcaP (DUF421 family)